jgi:hypothetical protein
MIPICIYTRLVFFTLFFVLACTDLLVALHPGSIITITITT